MDPLPRISVVIPIRNEERFIAQTIKYLQAQDYPADRYEIIVVDGESDDGTVKIVEEIAANDNRVKLLTNPKRLSSAARNVGAKNATGDIVTYVDGHTYIDNDQLLKSIASILEEKDVHVLSRPQFLETPENNEFQRAVALARRSKVGHGLDSTIYNENDAYVNPTSSGATYMKDVFEKVGYFDENFDACEDVDFNFRVGKAGYQSFTSMKLAVYYYPRESISSLFHQMKRYGQGRFRLSRKHPETLGLGTLIPFFFTVGVPFTAVMSAIHPIFNLLFTLAIVPYLLMIGASSVIVAAENGWEYLPLLPVIYVTIHVGLGWGFLIELVAHYTKKGTPTP